MVWRSKNVALTDQDGDAAEVDDLIGASVVMDSSHHLIHNGKSFEGFVSEETPGDGDKINIAFKTGTTSSSWHLFPLGASAGAAALRVFEGPDFTDNTGTSLTVFNRNRQSSNTPDVIDVKANPDETGKMTSGVTFNDATGTKIYEEYFGSDKDAGGQSRGEREIVLASDTFYVVEIEAKEADLAYISLNVNWYEL